MDEVLSSRYSLLLQALSELNSSGNNLYNESSKVCITLPFVRPAMIRSELRSALRRCPTEEEAGGGVQPVGQLQSLIAQRMQRAQELLEEMRLQVLHPLTRMEKCIMAGTNVVFSNSRSCRRRKRSENEEAAHRISKASTPRGSTTFEAQTLLSPGSFIFFCIDKMSLI